MNTAPLLFTVLSLVFLSCGGVDDPLSAEQQAVYASPSPSSTPSPSPSTSSSPTPSPSPTPTALTPEHTGCATSTRSLADCTSCCDGKFPRGTKASDLMYCVEVCKVADRARTEK